MRQYNYMICFAAVHKTETDVMQVFRTTKDNEKEIFSSISAILVTLRWTTKLQQTWGTLLVFNN